MYNLKIKKNCLLIQDELKKITYEINEEMKELESDCDTFGTLWEIQNKVENIKGYLQEVIKNV